MAEDLIIQGKAASRTTADTLALRIDASGVEQIAPTAFRLLNVTTLEGVAAFCAKVQLDYALVPADRRLVEVRLVAMDMDSTLITVETIDELADLVGKKAEVSALTAAAMRGELDYPESLRQRVKVLSGLGADALGRIYEERLKLSPGAEPMLARLRALGIKTLLVSGGFTYFTDRLKERLALDYTRANALQIAAGRLTGRVAEPIVDGQGKAAAVRDAARTIGITRDEIVAIGDGANDLPMMAEAGVSIAYKAKPAVREKATYCFNHVGLDGLLNLYR
jgi:phosphoserine phosphatase